MVKHTPQFSVPQHEPSVKEVEKTLVELVTKRMPPTMVGVVIHDTNSDIRTFAQGFVSEDQSELRIVTEYINALQRKGYFLGREKLLELFTGTSQTLEFIIETLHLMHAKVIDSIGLLRKNHLETIESLQDFANPEIITQIETAQHEDIAEVLRSYQEWATQTSAYDRVRSVVDRLLAPRLIMFSFHPGQIEEEEEE